MLHSDFFFCGIKHCGKSTLGRLCSRDFGLSWKDADSLVSSLLPPGDTIRSFYRREGQPAFQKLEVQALDAFLSNPHGQTIVSMGGGACDNPELMDLLGRHGLCVYLKLQEKTLFGRIVKDGIPPFLDASRPRESFHELYVRRDRLYDNQCPLVVELVDNADVEDNLHSLERILQGAGYGTQHIRI